MVWHEVIALSTNNPGSTRMAASPVEDLVASARAMMSVVPPSTNGTTEVIGLVGRASAASAGKNAALTMRARQPTMIGRR